MPNDDTLVHGTPAGKAMTLAPRNLFVCILSAAAFVGCESRSDVDRADYDRYERRYADDGPRARVRQVHVEPADGITARFDEQAETRPAPRTAPRHVATPVPTQITATAEAEDAPPRAAPATPPPAPSPAVDVGTVLRQADEHNRRGASSAAKGAWFTARTEFVEALRCVAAAADARAGRTDHTVAFQAGLTATTEAEAFTSRGAAQPLDLETLRRTHRTSAFLPPPARGASAVALHDAYLTFAKEQLAAAAMGYETGSVALHGLGKVHAAAGTTIADARAKARTFYEAALVVAPANFLAANDLAVLLAEDGRLEQARDCLHAGLRQSSQPAMWNNLAAVHDRLGQPQLAQAARQEAAALERRAASAPGSVLPTHNVAWLDPRNFAATSRPPTDVQQAAPTTAAPPAAAPSPNVPASAQRPVDGWTQRPRSGVLAY